MAGKTHPRKSAAQEDKPKDKMIAHGRKHARGRKSKPKGQ